MRHREIKSPRKVAGATRTETQTLCPVLYHRSLQTVLSIKTLCLPASSGRALAYFSRVKYINLLKKALAPRTPPQTEVTRNSKSRAALDPDSGRGEGDRLTKTAALKARTYHLKKLFKPRVAGLDRTSMQRLYRSSDHSSVSTAPSFTPPLVSLASRIRELRTSHEYC